MDKGQEPLLSSGENLEESSMMMKVELPTMDTKVVMLEYPASYKNVNESLAFPGTESWEKDLPMVLQQRY